MSHATYEIVPMLRGGEIARVRYTTADGKKYSALLPPGHDFLTDQVALDAYMESIAQREQRRHR